jgi:hypothetical protein
MNIKSYPAMSERSLKFVFWYRAIPVLFFITTLSIWIRYRGESVTHVFIYISIVLPLFLFIVALETWMASQREVTFNGVINYKIFKRNKFTADFANISVYVSDYDRSIKITPKPSLLGIKSARFAFVSDNELKKIEHLFKDKGVIINKRTKKDRLTKSCLIIVSIILFHWVTMVLIGAANKELIQSFLLFFYPALTISILSILRCLYLVDIT